MTDDQAVQAAIADPSAVTPRQAVPLPDEAVNAAQEAITRVLAEDWHDTWLENDEALARAALAAAMPALWSHFFATSHDLKLMLEAARRTGRAEERARWQQALGRHDICREGRCCLRDAADLLDGDTDG